MASNNKRHVKACLMTLPCPCRLRRWRADPLVGMWKLNVEKSETASGKTSFTVKHVKLGGYVRQLPNDIFQSPGTCYPAFGRQRARRHESRGGGDCRC